MYTSVYIVALTLLRLISTYLAESLPSTRIVGGYEVIPKFKYSWMVSIQGISSLGKNYHICGGMLLRNDTILTAAHCASDRILKNYKVFIHRHNLTLSTREENGVEADVTAIYTENYEHLGITNDIAVWKIKSNTTFTFNPITLDRWGDLTDSETIATALGWGVTSNSSGSSKILNRIEIPIVSFKSCSNYWNSQGYLLSDTKQVCAGGQGDRDVCSGDSGGPLLVTKNGKDVLVGLTSFGEACAIKGAPSVFTKVFSYLEFIDKNLK